MSIVRWVLNARRVAAVTFAVLFLVVPVALLTSLRLVPLILSVLSVGIVATIGGFVGPVSIRPRSRDAAKGVVTAAILLGILHFTGLLEPMYRREGWLLLELDIEISPLRVQPGDPLTYTLSTTNTEPRAALSRYYAVDGVPYDGLLMYGRIPDLDTVRFSLVEPPTVTLTSNDDPGRPLECPCTVVYANPGIPELNPTSWDWSTTYTPGDEVVAVISGDATTYHDLESGETLTLRYTVVVPPDHPPGEVHHVRASLAYRDPQWATYYTHDLWFPFEDDVLVEVASE